MEPERSVTRTTGGLATSGTTIRRWSRYGGTCHHLVDPRTGLPAARPFSACSAAPVDLRDHRELHRGPAFTGSRLIRAAHDAGLVGRGGAGFPTARKLSAVAGARPRGGRVVVANGTEGEPLSWKDKALLMSSPHLVLDGLCLAAGAVGADPRILCIERGNPEVDAAVRRAIAQRPRDGIELLTTPRRYVSGQEAALVDLVAGGPGRPSVADLLDVAGASTPRAVLFGGYFGRWIPAPTALGARPGADHPRRLGLPDVGRAIEGSLLAHARRAVTNCPALALRIERTKS
ncbi:MAG: hypothetical protein ACYDEN_03960 [Acidimicrobiales bacterium]